MNSDKSQTESFIHSIHQKDIQQNIDSEDDVRSASQNELYRFIASREASRSIRNAKVDIQRRVDADLIKANKNFDKAAEKIRDEMRDGVRQARNKIIEPLAVFVGLFTFVSVSFQIFTQVREYILWMPILGMTLGALVIFAGLVIHASSIDNDAAERRKYTWGVVGVGFALVIASGAYYYMAVDIVRKEDVRDCIMVKNDSDDNQYCKVRR